MDEVFEGVEEAACAISAENTYNKRVFWVKNQIFAKLQDRLGTVAMQM